MSVNELIFMKFALLYHFWLSFHTPNFMKITLKNLVLGARSHTHTRTHTHTHTQAHTDGRMDRLGLHTSYFHIPAVTMKVIVLPCVTPCSLVATYQRF